MGLGSFTANSGSSPGKGSRGRSPLLRKPNGFTTERMTFLIILEVLLTTWNSNYFVPFWQYNYGLTRTLTPLTTQIDLSRTDGWSRYFIPFETLMPKGILKYMCVEAAFWTFMHHELFTCPLIYASHLIQSSHMSILFAINRKQLAINLYTTLLIFVT